MIKPAPPPSILIFKEQMSFVEKWDKAFDAKEAVLGVINLKNGKGIRMETGATPMTS